MALFRERIVLRKAGSPIGECSVVVVVVVVVVCCWGCSYGCKIINVLDMCGAHFMSKATPFVVG
jgi:hypothetical protein